MPEIGLQSQSESGNVLQSAIRRANAADHPAIRFLPFFVALALLPPQEQIRQRIVPPDQEEAGEKRGDLYCVGHGLTIHLLHSP